MTADASPPRAGQRYWWAACYVLGALTLGTFPFAAGLYFWSRHRSGMYFHAMQSTFWNVLLAAIAVYPTWSYLMRSLATVFLPDAHFTRYEWRIGAAAVLLLPNLTLSLWAARRILLGHFFLYPLGGKSCIDRGIVWSERGSPDVALADYTAMLDLRGAPPIFRAAMLTARGMYWQLKHQADKALADVTAALAIPAIPAEHKASALWLRAAIRVDAGDFDGAIADTTAVLDQKDAPADFRVSMWIKRSRAWFGKGDFNKAIADYTQIIASRAAKPDYKAWALQNRGVLWGKKNEYDKAIEDLTAAIEMREASANQRAFALYCRGRCWDKKADSEKAVADYTSALDMGLASPEDKAWTLHLRGHCRYFQKDYDAAIADYTAIIEMPDAPAAAKASAFCARGASHSARGDSAKAVADYTAAINEPGTAAQTRAKALNNRSDHYYYDNGEIDSAIADCAAVLQMADAPDEERVNAFWFRGLCRGRQEDLAGMEQDARAALAIASDSINAHFVLALALLLANEVEAAKDEYGRAAGQCRKAGDIRHIGIHELERAMEDRGYIPGADEILEMLCDREDELQ